MQWLNWRRSGELWLDLSGPITAPGSNPSTTFTALAVSARRFGDGVVAAVLDQDAVGADLDLR